MASPLHQDHSVSAWHNKFGTFQVKIEQKTERANVQHGKRSPQKKAAVTKFKWLAALCVLNCVGAEVDVSGPAAPSAPSTLPSTSPSPSPSTMPSTDDLEALRARTAKLEAVVMVPPPSPPPPSLPPPLLAVAALAAATLAAAALARRPQPAAAVTATTAAIATAAVIAAAAVIVAALASPPSSPPCLRPLCMGRAA